MFPWAKLFNHGCFRTSSVVGVAKASLRRFCSANMSDDCLKPIVAVVQMNSSHDVEQNWQTVRTTVRQAKAMVPAVRMVFLPEGFDYIGRNRDESMKMAFREDSEYIARYRSLAKELNMWLSLGGFHEKVLFNDLYFLISSGIYEILITIGGLLSVLPIGHSSQFSMSKWSQLFQSSEERNYNTHLIVGSDGLVKSKYRKLHLFDLEIPGKIRVNETDFSIPGHQIEMPIQTPVGLLGLSTCYDLRFPHLASYLRASGSEILAYPSAFTVATGMDHWEVLLRAQAISTQCYVIAAAQTGKHNEKRASFGHSMVVDPWGTVVAQCSEGAPQVCFAPIDLQYVKKVRRDLPCFEHRRLDVYDAPSLQDIFIDPDSRQSYTFGDLTIPSQHIFLLSHLSYAFVNIKPILPGHVLISPLRKVEKFTGLTHAETSDLFRCVRIVERELERLFEVASTSITLQDGPEAGQSVKHVHVHIIPRKSDCMGDRIYAALAKHDKEMSGRRSEKEMEEEARKFRSLFY